MPKWTGFSRVAAAALLPRRLLPIVFLVGGLWTLTLLDTAAKSLAMVGYHVVMIAWMRYAINAALLAVTLAPLYRSRKGKSILATAHPGLQILRALVMLAGTTIFFAVLKIVPLAEGTAMNFMAPLLVLAASPWLLGEKGYASRWIAVAVAFVGMLVVVRPGGSISPLGVALGLLSAAVQAAFAILNRKLNQKEDPLVTLFYGALIGALGSSLLVPFFWSPHAPDWQVMLILASTGITSTLGHFLMNSAYRHAEASLLTPFIYLQVVSATTMGWLVFRQLPDRWTALGIAIICVSGIAIAYVEGRRQRRR